MQQAGRDVGLHLDGGDADRRVLCQHRVGEGARGDITGGLGRLSGFLYTGGTQVVHRWYTGGTQVVHRWYACCYRWFTCGHKWSQVIHRWSQVEHRWSQVVTGGTQVVTGGHRWYTDGHKWYTGGTQVVTGGTQVVTGGTQVVSWHSRMGRERGGRGEGGGREVKHQAVGQGWRGMQGMLCVWGGGGGGGGEVRLWGWGGREGTKLAGSVLY